MAANWRAEIRGWIGHFRGAQESIVHNQQRNQHIHQIDPQIRQHFDTTQGTSRHAGAAIIVFIEPIEEGCDGLVPQRAETVASGNLPVFELLLQLSGNWRQKP